MEQVKEPVTFLPSDEKVAGALRVDVEVLSTFRTGMADILADMPGEAASSRFQQVRTALGRAINGPADEPSQELAPVVELRPDADRDAERRQAKRGLVAAAAAGVVALAGIFGLGSSGENSASASARVAAVSGKSDVEKEYLGVNPRTDLVAAVHGVENDEREVDDEIIYYAEWADLEEPGSHEFGPSGLMPMEGKTERQEARDAFNDMFARLSDDPAMLVSHMEYTGLLDVDTPEERDEKVAEFAEDEDAMRRGYERIHDFLTDQESVRLDIEYFTGSYYTKYQVINTFDGRPGIYQSVEHMENEPLLVVEVEDEDGNVEVFKFKIECGYQEVQDVPFENVPTEEELPEGEGGPDEDEETTTTTRPVTTTTRPTTTSTTAPSTTTSSTTSSTVPSTTTSSTSTTSSTVPSTTTSSTTSTSTTSTTAPTTTSSTSTTSTSTTSTSTTSTSTTSTTQPTTTTTETTIPPKEDDGELPGNPEVPADQDPGTPDVPGEGPAEQPTDEDGYTENETPPPTEGPIDEEGESTTTTQLPATTAPQPTSTLPPASVTTVVPTTRPEDQMPELP